MKTLEQWQKELPDYDVFHGLTLDNWKGSEVRCEDAWIPLETREGRYGAWVNGEFVHGYQLSQVGAIFRRKKERQREFKIEFGDDYDRVMIDGKCICLCQLHRSGTFPKGTSATLTVNEWGGE